MIKSDWKLRSDSESYTIDSLIWKSKNDGLLSIQSPFNKRFLFRTNNQYQGLWKYQPQIPVFSPQNIVSFGEGFTPIAKEKLNDKDVILKLESIMPTGSFKDRGASILISRIKELGISEVVEDSSGNAGSAIAAYAAKAGIKCTIYISEHASPAKINQIKGYGAKVEIIKGDRQDVSNAVKKAAESSYYASHVYNPFFFEGTKTFAYEIWEQCKQMPEEIIFPVGNGTLIIGTYIGFLELLNAGLIEQIPALSAAQAKNCPSLSDLDASSPRFQSTKAEGIAVKNPARRQKINEIIKVTGGSHYLVAENEFLKSHQDLYQKGYFIEFTSAVATAARQYSSNTEVLVPLTGHGLKNS